MTKTNLKKTAPLAQIKNTGAEEQRWKALMQEVSRNQSKAAFREIFDFFAPRLKALYLKSGLDPQKAEELLQDVMYKVWNKADSFDAEKSALSTWIYTIARNSRIDYFRKSRLSTVTLEDDNRFTDERDNAEQTVQTLQQKKIIAEAIHQLPEEQLDLLQKAFYEDKSHSEIAEETKLPLGTVKSRIRLALKKLKILLDE